MIYKGLNEKETVPFLMFFTMAYSQQKRFYPDKQQIQMTENNITDADLKEFTIRVADIEARYRLCRAQRLGEIAQ